MFQKLARYFFRGLLIVAPVAVTVYVVYRLFVMIDGWIELEWLGLEQWIGGSIPGVGFVITLALIVLIGLLASNFATRWLFRIMDGVFTRVPFIKLLYSSLKDLIGAFVGEKKRFDKPVLVTPGGGLDLVLMGFQTRDDLGEFGMADHVAVYFPQSYNFAGNVFVVPRERVRPVEADSTAVMTFIVSGGVSGQTETRALKEGQGGKQG